MSTNLILSGRPTQQSQFESLQKELFERNRQLNEAERRNLDLENQLREERLKSVQIERGVQKLRDILSPLYGGLRMVFGEIEGMDLDDSPVASSSSHASPSKSAVWDSWKEQLGGKASQAIDALLLHGEMTYAQLGIHIGTKRKQTIYDTVHRLHKANLVNKDNGKVSLKQL